ncbi:hypothetical protein L7F22_019742 [Adiantum nelumboides]|nr:hypothetical protein [Adiantum nelumboides]
MGCTICLEAFGDDDDRGMRPVALPCGHVFHRICSDAWLRECRTKGSPACCPICKKELGESHSIPLWPSDVNDLDVYVQNRNRRQDKQRTINDRARQAPAAKALDNYMTRDAQSALLGKLMDFRQHINAYVMSVNNVSMSAHGGEDRIFRLFNDVTKAPAQNAEFRDAIKSLSAATSTLSTTVQSIESDRKQIESDKINTSVSLERAEVMRKSWQTHMETKASEEQRMNDNKRQVDVLMRHAKKELQDLERKKAELAKERESMKHEVQEQKRQVAVARVEAAQLMAKYRGDTDVEVQKMTSYMQEQERLRIEAEQLRNVSEESKKWLADRNKLISTKLDSTRLENKNLKAEIQALKARLSTQIDDFKGKGKEEEEETGNAVKREPAEGDDLSANEASTSSSSKLDDIPSFTQGSSEGSAKQEEDDEDDDGIVILDDDIEAEFDDKSYALPSWINTAHKAPVARPSSSSAWSGTSGNVTSFAPSNRQGLRRTRTEISIDDDDEQDDSVEFVTCKQRNTGTTTTPRSGLSDSMPSNSTLIDRIMSGSRQAFGPRRRR